MPNPDYLASLYPHVLINSMGRIIILLERVMSEKFLGCCLVCSNFYNQNMVVNLYMLFSFIKAFTYFFSFDLHYHYVVDIFSVTILYLKLTDVEILY